MSYKSIEAIQEALSNTVFKERKDSRKAAGRALGSLVELITFYLLKDYGLVENLSIERPLYEFANQEISHNVEFTLHSSKLIEEFTFDKRENLTYTIIKRKANINPDKSFKKKSVSPYRNGVLRNAANIFESDTRLINAYTDSKTNTVSLCLLKKSPFAMFECKRVGIEKGMKKGPQTIEKAKQGAYVSRVVSKLQRVKRLDGSFAGVLEEQDGSFTIGDYNQMLNKLIKRGNPKELKDIVITVGVISNHGNWFTQDNQNKEIRVLSQSYDWLLFLTDEGLTQFINEVILSSNTKLENTRKAFIDSYDKDKIPKVSFTKTTLPIEADRELTEYFMDNREKISSWFNILTPKDETLENLMYELKLLTEVNSLESDD